MRSLSALLVCLAAAFGIMLTGAANAEEAAWGTVKGRIVFDGAAAPEPAQINVDKDQAHCLAKGNLFSEELVVNKKNLGVRWVFVWLAPAKGEPPLKVHPKLKPIKNKPHEIDQPCCQFVPHALAIREGEEILAKNSSAIPHNVHWQGHPLKNPGDNKIVPAAQSLPIKDLKADRFPVKINCDIHGWMSAWVRVFDHPYFAVTDESGKFELKQAPAGNYRMVIWHESGWGSGGKEGQAVTIQGGETMDLGDVKFKPPQ
jgi:hypothetical protein